MKVYLAAPWVHKHTAQAAKHYLQQRGFEVVSTWTEQNETDGPETFERHAMSDWSELNAAEVLVILNLGKSDGKASEMGGALMANKPVVLIGSREGNIFYNLPQVTRVYRIEEAADVLMALVGPTA